MKNKHISLKDKYNNKVVGELMNEFKIKNKHAVPVIQKIVINMGTQDKLRDKKIKDKLISEIAIITGQRPKMQPAKVSIAGFSLREGMPVGLTSTLRGARMYEFLDRFISVVLPRTRDFRGVSRKSFDKNGNYSLGIKEHTLFPEIDITKVSTNQGLQVTLTIKNSNKKKSLKLLKLMGMPFEKLNN